MTDVFVFLTDGFEEIEALSVIDICRRAELAVQSVSLTQKKWVTGAHQINVEADVLFEDIRPENATLLVVPGGTVKFNDHEGLKNALKQAAQNPNKHIGAICAAPMVLGGLGLLQGKDATCYPGFEKYLEGAIVRESEAVVTDGAITTGLGPGFANDFALELVALIAGQDRADKVAKDLLLL